MISFRDRYKAYVKAKQKADSVTIWLALLIAFIVVAIIDVPILLSTDWSFTGYMFFNIPVLLLGGVALVFSFSLINRNLLRYYFKKELMKLTKI